MSTSADLEIGLHRRDSDSYAVDFRFNQPDSDTDVRLGQGTARFDLQALGKLQPGSQEYSQALTSSLFSDPAVQTAFAQALTSAQTQNLPLRVRLLIGPSAPELQSLHWETINNPQDNSPLASGENLLFSRYLSSLDWRPVPLRPKADMRALVVISNPSNLSEYQNLAAIDVEGELARAREALGNIPLTLLPDPAAPEQYATLNNIAARLRDGAHDILYLVCHGAISQDAPFLWLQDEAGKVAITSGDELVTVLRGLSSRPRLVVLASCQSAGNPTMGDALTALGPRMSQAGIPAVIAMQGNISLETMAEFMPVFFNELQRMGRLTAPFPSLAALCASVPIIWMPALFMRLKSGRIWYVPGFGDERSAFEKWPSILRTISRSQCTPILGPGLYESVLGSQADIARRWAEAYHYPMAPHEREVAPPGGSIPDRQPVRTRPVRRAGRIPEGRSKQALRTISCLQKCFNNNTPLDQLVETDWPATAAQHTPRRLQVLAELPLPVYITTNPNNLMAVALKEAGKTHRLSCAPGTTTSSNWKQFTIVSRTTSHPQMTAGLPFIRTPG